MMTELRQRSNGRVTPSLKKGVRSPLLDRTRSSRAAVGGVAGDENEDEDGLAGPTQEADATTVRARRHCRARERPGVPVETQGRYDREPGPPPPRPSAP